MNSIPTAGTILASLLAAIWAGRWLRRWLPEHHLSSDTRDTVKLAMGLVATMSALILGLLVSSAKTSYDTVRNDVIQMAAKIAFLDRVLAAYGPEAADARTKFRATADDSIARMWPKEEKTPVQLAPNAEAGRQAFAAIQALSPQTDPQRVLKAQAHTLAIELGELQFLLLAQSVASISKPLLIVVVCWLVMIFLSFSLLAPPNLTAAMALVVSALSVSAALLLILELDRPFGGLIRIPNESLMNTMRQLPK